jgi:gluconolactonase
MANQSSTSTQVKFDKGLSGLMESPGVERIAGGHQFTEGPAWHPGGYLIYSDIPADRICFWTDEGVKSYRKPSGNSNGLIFDRTLRLVACEHGNRRVSRTELDFAVIAIAERFQGRRLNSPNDLVEHSDGSIYFTDPPYGVEARDRELDFQGVYRIAPDGELQLIAKDFEKPNGLAFSPDEQTLYIDDSARRHIRAFCVLSGGGVTDDGFFAEMQSNEPGSPDGMKVDAEGRVWCTGPEGVWVFDPAGDCIGILPVPEKPSNCCWGDPDRRTLFITARSSVYRVRTKVSGVDVLRTSGQSAITKGSNKHV